MKKLWINIFELISRKLKLLYGFLHPLFEKENLKVWIRYSDREKKIDRSNTRSTLVFTLKSTTPLKLGSFKSITTVALSKSFSCHNWKAPTRTLTLPADITNISFHGNIIFWIFTRIVVVSANSNVFNDGIKKMA